MSLLSVGKAVATDLVGYVLTPRIPDMTTLRIAVGVGTTADYRAKQFECANHLLLLAAKVAALAAVGWLMAISTAGHLALLGLGVVGGLVCAESVLKNPYMFRGVFNPEEMCRHVVYESVKWAFVALCALRVTTAVLPIGRLVRVIMHIPLVLLD